MEERLIHLPPKYSVDALEFEMEVSVNSIHASGTEITVSPKVMF